ncbi:aryl-alcohol dehydrogenase-like predicted oxidoreductase [Williamsia muralis]|uniref:Aryl-alcohol dehydrogenase-like predicted oxidoreductase n=1 Tax=Williamsia marianensis TaxID=85044 RepID=A0A495K5D7_WILMA|nr:aldo/keto reductase [Williamsia muralis]RKR96510.1 aryl-alcohol dehydrogenase-like predicted oxidoreductase [Williamsia muralis]
MTSNTTAAQQSGQFAIGGSLNVNRLGYGTMQLTGPGVWGPPANPEEAVKVLRRAVDLGVNLIDTADSYGPAIAEPLIKEALHPYTDDLVIATKAGLTRSGPGDWRPVGRPEYLRQQAEMSLRILDIERIPLFQLHRIDPKVDLADQIGELKLLQEEGKINQIGLSEINVDQLIEAQKIVEIASVQNLYNLTNRSAQPLLDHCTAENIGFIPWFPLATGELAGPGSKLAAIAEQKQASPSQLALAWLLAKSPVILPIPGTSSVDHLEDNMAAAGIELSENDIDALTAAVEE